MLRLLALALWLGALVGFAFIFAPTAFAQIGPTPTFATTIADTLALLMRTGDWCGIVAVAVTALAHLDRRRTAAIIVACIALAIILGFVETQNIIPHMQTTLPGSAAFAQLHQRSSAVYAIIALAVFVAFGFSSYRCSQAAE